VNDSGTVVGIYYAALTGGFIYQNGKMTDLNVPGGGQPTAINKAEQITATGYNVKVGVGATQTGYVYINGTCLDLNTLVSAIDGWFIDSAAGTNNKGQITGTLQKTAGTNVEHRAYLLTPIAGTAADPAARKK
jgi:hypothetical protein